MGKRRKFTAPSTSTAPSPRMRIEIKEEKSLLGDVVAARERLRGALQDIAEHSDDSAPSSGDEGAPTPHADAARAPLIKKEPSLPVPPNMKNFRQQQRRRRRRELLSENAFHHTFVLKLFDRSVDLAQFKEATPLYPVCRAWMANQPHNTNLVPKLRTPTPEPPPEDQASAADTSGSGDDAEVVRDTYKMPAPQPLPENAEGRRKLRIPSPVRRENEPMELDYDAKNPPSKDELLQEHLEHWTAVRKKWQDATRQNSARYEESARILKAIYKKALKAYE